MFVKKAYWGRSLTDFIFPFICPGCQDVQGSEGFCPECWKRLDFISTPICLLCGNPSSSQEKGLCYQCRLWTPLFTSHRSLWRYGPMSRKVIFSLKHGHYKYLAHLFAQWLVPLAAGLSVHYIIPVPLHPGKLKQRGFNQAAILAQEFSRLTGIPILLESLLRVTETVSQGRFSHSRRTENVEGAFECVEHPFLEGADILLIDDVYTTGATLNACTKALRGAGVSQIHGLTLAKVVRT